MRRSKNEGGAASEKWVTRAANENSQVAKSSSRGGLTSLEAAVVANSFVSRAGEAYDARARGPSQKSRSTSRAAAMKRKIDGSLEVSCST
jgi:hypothetical protein